MSPRAVLHIFIERTTVRCNTCISFKLEILKKVTENKIYILNGQLNSTQFHYGQQHENWVVMGQ